MSAESNSQCPVCRTADIVCGKWTLLIIRDLAERHQPLLRARAVAGGDQPADPLAAPAGARRGGDRRPPDLPRGAAAGRVRADREGRSAGPADRGHAPLRRRWLLERRAPSRSSPPMSRRSARPSCRRRSARPGGEAWSRARPSPQRGPEAPRRRSGDPLQRRWSPAATRSPSTSPSRPVPTRPSTATSR